MQEILLMNPRNRRRAARKMTAKQAKYFAPRKGGARRRKAIAMRSNPVRRRTRTKARTVTSFRRNPRRRRNVSFRRNPIGMMGGNFIGETLMPSVAGAAGAIGVDLLLGYFGGYLPASFTTGWMNYATKLVAAIGLGFVADRFGGRRFGEQVMNGAITVTVYDIIKAQIISMAPGTPGLSYYSPAMQLGNYVDGGWNFANMQQIAMPQYQQQVVPTDVTNPPADGSGDASGGLGYYVEGNGYF